MRANSSRRGHSCARRTFQLPPSHEGELGPVGNVLGVTLFQLPPSHEGERVVLF